MVSVDNFTWLAEMGKEGEQYSLDLVFEDDRKEVHHNYAGFKEDFDIDTIKIDVEGYEYEVLKGSVETISKNKPWVVVEINDNRKSILNFFKKLNYKKPYDISKNYFIFIPQTDKKFTYINRHIISEKLKKIYEKFFN